jgi:hypothetical protein
MVFLHLLGSFAFVLGHGASIAVAFRLRKERDRARIAALLDVSSWGITFMYIGLLVLIVAGVVLGFMGGYWGSWWLWVSIVLFVLVMGAMYGIAMPYYRGVRVLSGARMPESARAKAEERATEGLLETLPTSWRPSALAAIGGVGLAVIIWLMIAQPS